MPQVVPTGPESKQAPSLGVQSGSMHPDYRNHKETIWDTTGQKVLLPHRHDSLEQQDPLSADSPQVFHASFGGVNDAKPRHNFLDLAAKIRQRAEHQEHSKGHNSEVS